MGILGTIHFNMQNMKKAKKLRAMTAEEIIAMNDEDFFCAVECLCEDAVYDIKSSDISEEQKLVYSLNRFEAEVNNGGMCQFLVNSSSECAPYISKALEEIDALALKEAFDGFIADNHIDVYDLSSFKISDISEFEAQTERFDFDSFDDKFYKDDEFHQKVIDYARKNINNLMK